MIRLAEDRRDVGGVALGAVWIGNSADEQLADIDREGVKSILNVAQDLVSTRGWWHGIEAAHVGLIDGPGNEPAMYCAAILTLHSLLKRHNVLVCCHGVNRSLAVCAMHGALTSFTSLERQIAMLREKVECDLPEVGEVHVKAFESIDRRSMAQLLGVR